jgi:hypothetical protein
VATARQLELFRQKEQKEAEALQKAMTRLTAVFGQQALVQPRLVDTHRLEARVAWGEPEPFVLTEAKRLWPFHSGLRPSVRANGMVLRRIDPPERIQWDPGPSSTWLRRSGRPAQRLRRTDGPRRLSGEWWDTPFERSYYWLETLDGELLLAFRDEADGALYLQAEAD